MSKDDLYEKGTALESCVGLTIREVSHRNSGKVVLTLDDGRKIRIESNSKLRFGVVGESAKPKQAFAIGRSTDKVEFCLHYGPFPTNRECLCQSGEDEHEYIVEVSGPKSVPVFQWNPGSQSWKLLPEFKNVKVK